MKKAKTAEQIEDERPKMAEYLDDGHPNPEAMDVWQFMQVLDDKNLWDHYIAYLFRIEPKRAGDKNPNIGCFSTSLSLEHVRRVYGGRKFTLILNRKVGTRQPTVYKAQFDIEAAPIYQDNEDDRIGRVASKGGVPMDAVDSAKPDPLLTKLVDDLIEQRDQMVSRGETFDTGAALQNAISLQNEGFKAAISSIAANAGKSNSAGVDTESWIKLITLVMPLIQPLLTPKQDPLTQAIIQKYINESAQPKESAEKTSVNTAIELIREIRSEFGKGGAGGGRLDWPAVAMSAVEKLPEILAHGSQVIENAMKLKGMPATTNGAERQPQRAMPAATTEHPNRPGAREIQPGAELTPEQKQQAEIMLVQLYGVRAKEIIVKKLFDGPEGDSNSGGEIAAIVISEMHPDYAMGLAKQFERAMTGDQQQIAAFRADPILGQIFNNPKVTLTMVQAFAKDFCETIHDRAEEEAERAARTTIHSVSPDKVDTQPAAEAQP